MRILQIKGILEAMNASPPRTELRDTADIKTLVDAFYAKVVVDPLIGPIFTDIAQVDFAHHLPEMYKFWETLLFKSGGYTGRPFPKHAPLPLEPAHFARWLNLFRGTVDELFAGAKAEDAKGWAESIAHTFQQRLGLIPPGAPREAVSQGS